MYCDVTTWCVVFRQLFFHFLNPKQKQKQKNNTPPPGTFTLNVTRDAVDELDEDMTLTLSNANAAAAIGTASGVIRIIDDDTVSLVPQTLSFSEADGAVVAIAVQMIGVSDRPVTVQFATISGSATAPEDYTATSGTLTWAALEQSALKTHTMALTDDNINEPTETLSLSYFGPTGGAVLAAGLATITVTDDDSSTLYARASSVAEATATSAAIGVLLVGARSEVTTVTYVASRVVFFFFFPFIYFAL